MVNALFYAIFWIIVLGFAYWAVGLLALPHPFGQLARAAIILAAVLVIFWLVYTAAPLPAGVR